MLDLAARLKCNRAAAIGYVQLLIDWVADYAIQGDVGKWPNGAIAMGCDWQGDPDEFVSALVEARWLKEDDSCRLYLNDWPDHAERWVKLKMGKTNQRFHSIYGSVERSIEATTESPTGASSPRDPDEPRLTEPITYDRLERPIDEQILKADCQKATDDIDPPGDRRGPLTDRDRDFCIRAIMAKWEVAGLNPHEIHERIRQMRREGNPPNNPWAYFRGAIQKRLAKLGYDPHTLDALPIPESMQRERQREAEPVP